jgi:HPt (histidine-containing phosphotransfer) domain-containing protein
MTAPGKGTRLSTGFTNVVNASFTMLSAFCRLPAAPDTGLTGGDAELEQELLVLFADQCTRQLAMIRDTASRQVRSDAAHTLKGAAFAIGAWEVGEAAAAIEHALSASGDSADLAARLNALDKATACACSMICALQKAA